MLINEINVDKEIIIIVSKNVCLFIIDFDWKADWEAREYKSAITPAVNTHTLNQTTK